MIGVVLARGGTLKYPVAALLVARVVFAQHPTTPHAALVAIPVNAPIRLQLATGGGTMAGTLVSVSDSAITIRADTIAVVAFDHIYSVSLRSASSAKRGAATGALVAGSATAAVFGVAFAALCEDSCGSAGVSGALFGALAGGLGGAATGAVIGSFFTHWREYWRRDTGTRFALDPSRTQILVEAHGRWRIEPAVGIGGPLDGSRTSHLPLAASLTVLRELRAARGVGLEAGYIDVGGRRRDDPLYSSETNEVRSSTFQVLARSASSAKIGSRRYWVVGAGVGTHQINSNSPGGARIQLRQTWPLVTLGTGMSFSWLDVRARVFAPVRLPSGGAVLLLLSAGPRF